MEYGNIELRTCAQYGISSYAMDEDEVEVAAVGYAALQLDCQPAAASRHVYWQLERI